MRRGLLLIVIVLVAILAWPAMTPGLFSGEGVRDAWRMAAEVPHRLAYAPRFRKVFPHALAPEAALRTPLSRQQFADIRPEIERRVRPLYAQLAAIQVQDVWWDEWWFVPVDLDFVPLPGARHRHHHHHPPVVGAVPEPSTWLLMITGFGLVGLALRVRRGASRTA